MNLCLLQIADSALPISGYTHSWGLEAAIGRRLVHDPETLERWTAHWLRNALGPLEGVLVAAGCRAGQASIPSQLLALNHLAEVSIVPPSTRTASREMGEQLVALGSTWSWSAQKLEPFIRTCARADSSLAPLGCLRPDGRTRRCWAGGRVDGLLAPGCSRDDRRGRPRDPRRPHPRPAGAGLSSGRYPEPGCGSGRSRPGNRRRTAAPSTRYSAMSKLDFMPECFGPEPWLDALVSLARHASVAVPGGASPSTKITSIRTTTWGGPAQPATPGPKRQVYTIGVAGPVGSGKTALVERSVAISGPRSTSPSSPTIFTRTRMPSSCRGAERCPVERIVGVQTGGCPHTAIRDDASANLSAIANFQRQFPVWSWSSSSRAAIT